MVSAVSSGGPAGPLLTLTVADRGAGLFGVAQGDVHQLHVAAAHR